MQLTGNTILITGGTSGIGRALAEHLYARGNVVIVAGRRQDRLNELTAAHPGMHGVALDVQDPAALAACAAQVQERFPALNVLVNNAGISRMENLNAEPVDRSVAQAIIQTNIVSVLDLTARLLPALRRQPRATIVTTSSGLAFVPRAAYPTYCASKAFVHSWLQSLRVQLRGTSVEVLELIPPYVQTELGGERQLADPHAMPLADYTSEVLGALERGDTPDGEILVENVRPQRLAEREGRYRQMFERYNPS